MQNKFSQSREPCSEILHILKNTGFAHQVKPHFIFCIATTILVTKIVQCQTNIKPKQHITINSKYHLPACNC